MDLGEEEKVCCSILRDADKIDIFRVNYETSFEDIYNATTSQLKTASANRKVKECFDCRRAVLKAWKKTPTNHIASLICLIF